MGMMEIRCALPDGNLSREEVGDDQTQSRKPPPVSQDAFRACLIFLPHTTLANRRIPGITGALRITLRDLNRSMTSALPPSTASSALM